MEDAEQRSSTQTTPSMERVDSHHHLWRYTPEEYSWIDGELKALRRDFLLDDLRTELAATNVRGTVVVQARQIGAETDWLLDAAHEVGSPILGVVGWLPLASETLPELLERYSASPKLKGVRHVVQAESDGFLDEKAFLRGVSKLEGAGLSYDILIYARQLGEAVRFVDRFPRQRFVLDHAAKPDIRGGGLAAWSSDLRELAKRSNVACKLSGMVTEADPKHWNAQQLEPYMETVLSAFGPQRVMTGTDWPVLTVGCGYAEWWNLVEDWTRSLSHDERGAILGGTAKAWYRLD